MSDIATRIRAKITKSADGCHRWTGYIQPNGYASHSINRKTTYIHRWAYEQAKGPIPDGLTIDHLCRTRHCVNPDHLEAVSVRTNVMRGVSVTANNARKTQCPQGHPYSVDNTYVVPKTGWRQCRACQKARR